MSVQKSLQLQPIIVKEKKTNSPLWLIFVTQKFKIQFQYFCQAFVDFCIDTIFEMQHSSSISCEEPEPEALQGEGEEPKVTVFRAVLDGTKTSMSAFMELLSPSKFRTHFSELQQMSKADLVKFFFKLNIDLGFFLVRVSFNGFGIIVRCLFHMVLGSRDANTVAVEPTGVDVSNLAVESHEPISGAEVSSEVAAAGEASTEENAAIKKASAAPAPAAAEPLAEEATEEVTETKKAPKSAGFKAFSSMLARNFYVLKTIGLTLAFVINIFMLFYKAQIVEDGSGEGNVFFI